MYTYSKRLHLLVSASIVIVVGLIYGLNPSKILPLVFGFEVEDLELKNIFRAIMGLYLAFAIYWILGAFKADYWKRATILNVLFMGGLAFGRIISTIFDGFSEQFFKGLILELIFLIWGIFNLNIENKESTA